MLFCVLYQHSLTVVIFLLQMEAETSLSSPSIMAYEMPNYETTHSPHNPLDSKTSLIKTVRLKRLIICTSLLAIIAL